MSDQLESMKDQFHSVVAQGKAMAFIKIIHANPDVTLAEAAAFADGCGLEDVTLGQAFLGKLPKTGKGWAKRLAQKKQPRALRTAGGRVKKTGKLNLRLQADRDIYDQKLLSFLMKKRDWLAAKDIRDRCGGDPHQARAGLNRLIESGHIQYRGRANGVRYKAGK